MYPNQSKLFHHESAGAVTPTVNHLGAANVLTALETIRILGPISRAKLARRSQFKPAALTRLVRYLIEEGLVIETEEIRSSITYGRPGRLLQVNKGSKSVLGIDIEPDYLRMAVTDLGGAILNYRQIVCDRHQSPEARFDLIRSTAADMGIQAGDVVRVGASCAGHIDEATGHVLSSTNLPKWHNVPVRDWLEEIFGVPVRIGRSIHQAAWAEHWFREEHETGRVIVITLRTGIGFALIDHGSIYQGRDGFDGELGHTLVDMNGPVCECGRRGCLETFISPASITRRVRAMIHEGRANRLAPFLTAGLEIDPELIYRLARDGDADCREIVSDLVRYLGIGIANLVNLLNPDSAVLCGAIDIVNEGLLESLRKEVQSQCLPGSWKNLQIRLSKHAERSALLGAAMRAAQDYANAVVKSHANV